MNRTSRDRPHPEPEPNAYRDTEPPDGPVGTWWERFEGPGGGLATPTTRLGWAVRVAECVFAVVAVPLAYLWVVRQAWRWLAG